MSTVLKKNRRKPQTTVTRHACLFDITPRGWGYASVWPHQRKLDLMLRLVEDYSVFKASVTHRSLKVMLKATPRNRIDTEEWKHSDIIRTAKELRQLVAAISVMLDDHHSEREE